MLLLKIWRKGACVLHLLLEAGEELWVLQVCDSASGLNLCLSR